ncbi:MAG: hypothetical protein JWM93_2315 [Frankiales bacterium]|nr:hypothetical protein [Frankiales bacterium]
MSSLAGLVAAIVVAAAGPSHTVRPTVLFAGLHLTPIQLLPVADRRIRTCTVRREHAQAQAGRVERAMEPVACEQPPRSKVILTFSGGLFGNGR